MQNTASSSVTCVCSMHEQMWSLFQSCQTGLQQSNSLTLDLERSGKATDAALAVIEQHRDLYFDIMDKIAWALASSMASTPSELGIVARVLQARTEHDDSCSDSALTRSLCRDVIALSDSWT